MKYEPIFFERNRVRRVYSGGKLFHNFFGDEPIDSFLPEEWIASSVTALNKEMRSEKEGVSKIRNSDMYFDELLEKYPVEMLGENKKLRILVKILDSAVRLPAQAHPDKVFSKKHFNSEYGKTESWILLDKRPDARIYFGFKNGVTKETFMKAVEESETNKNAMAELMEYIEPEIGDVFLVPARTVHAIGAGCLILEIQEPTDFTIQPEHWCDNYHLSDNEMYIGLDKDTAVECFDFKQLSDTKLIPVTESDSDGTKIEKLIKETDTDCFVVNRITIDSGKYKINGDGYRIYIVIDGKGTLNGDGYTKDIKKGDYFFIPSCLVDRFFICGNIQIIECY